MRRGTVVLVPFDFTDRTGATWRPAAVVSSTAYNRGPDVVIASITGNLTAVSHPGDHRLLDWKAAGLLRESLLQAKLATVESALLGRQLGRLSTRDLAAFDKGLIVTLGLEEAV